VQDKTPAGRDLIFATVSVPVPARAGGLFTYSVPPGMDVARGSMVMVPLGPRVLPGIVVRVGGSPPDMPTRDVLGVVDGAPTISPARAEVALWMAEQYRSSPFDALSLFMPPGWRRALTGHEGSLPLSRRWVFRWPHFLDDDAIVAPASAEPDGNGKRGGGVRSRVLSALIAGGPAPVAAVALAARCAPLTVRRMVGEGLLVEVPSPPLTPRAGEIGRPTITLNSSQAAAFAPIAGALERRLHKTFLLHGVTGSGKTHIYLRLIESLVRSGRQAIVLVSEIAQTPEALERYAEHFPGRVALMHSHLPSARRMEMWAAIAGRRYDVVIGPRSALFAPVPDLGLVVLDEEHEPAYKQESPAPRYHAREVAIQIGRRTGAPVVLGSATPDVVSYYLAEQGVYRLIPLRDRYSGPRGSGWSAGILPAVQVIDLKEELRSGNASILSRALQNELNGALARGEQSILFLNRRGSATCIMCRDCGHVAKCRRCDVPLVYHRDAEEAVCH
jgi:primosomal protein N' (replication factor Y) (superfamily II helicase)